MSDYMDGYHRGVKDSVYKKLTCGGKYPPMQEAYIPESDMRLGEIRQDVDGHSAVVAWIVSDCPGCWFTRVVGRWDSQYGSDLNGDKQIETCGFCGTSFIANAPREWVIKNDLAYDSRKLP